MNFFQAQSTKLMSSTFKLSLFTTSSYSLAMIFKFSFYYLNSAWIWSLPHCPAISIKKLCFFFSCVDEDSLNS